VQNRITNADTPQHRPADTFLPPSVNPVNPIELFVANIEASLTNRSFRRLTLGKCRDSLDGVKHVYIRPVNLKNGTHLSLVRRYPDRDLTQNYLISDGLSLVCDWLGKSSLAATLFTVDQRQQLIFDRQGHPRLFTSFGETVENHLQHDREKTRLLQDDTFLKHLGILDPAGKPRTQMGGKYRQIHHFIELLAPTLRSLPTGRKLRVVDMGSGKGYLTFALYAFFKQAGYDAEVLGIERRRVLVDLCNQFAAQCEFDGLRFEVGEITDVPLEGVDVVVALHACDTATDDALYRGIAAKAQLIFLAPCCHKEVRPQLMPPSDLAPLFRHGIQAERMAESITDALRCMYLEACGYATTIQEFIPLEHTQKNLLLSAIRNPKPFDRDLLFRKASEFQAWFGIAHQRLADLLAVEKH
jgi:SAM-dependent methyltransferase